MIKQRQYQAMKDVSFKKLLTISAFLFMGLMIGTWFVFSFEREGTQYIIGAGGVLVITVIIILARTYIIGQKHASSPSGQNREGSQVGFVVDTFHDLVENLKDKEKELEKLKAFAEEKAGRMEAYNENILRSVPSGVITIDNAMTIKSINHAAEHILGMDAGEAADRNIGDVFREPLTAIMKEHRTVSRGEYPYVTNDNRHIWLGITTSQLKNTADENIGTIFVFTDLTDIKALQTQVELRQRLSQLGEMSAGISHELRNSMSVVSGYAKLLGRKVDPSAKDTVNAISAEISNMDKIISELLAFAKPSVLNREKIDLNKTIKETTVSAVRENDTIRISVNAEVPVSVDADEVLLRQALSNLFINAVDAMPEGGSLEIETARLNNKAVIHIRDTGHGIPEGIKQKIFLPFYTTKETGTGFGLALVQKIIVSHGGSIDVESREGEGSEFRITLPAAE